MFYKVALFHNHFILHRVNMEISTLHHKVCSIAIIIYPVTMVNMGYHCGLSVIYPQFELAVRYLGINHYCSLSLISNHYFGCLPISHS